MNLPLYKYVEKNGIIYKLEGDYYYPEVFTTVEEENLSLSVAGRAKLEFMKERELALYVELALRDGLADYLRDYCGDDDG